MPFFNPWAAMSLARRCLKVSLAPILIVLGCVGSRPAACAGVDFQKEVRPILADHCFNCHGPDSGRRKAGLRLDRRRDAVLRLESGHTAIVPGKPDESAILARVASEDSEERMPPAKTGKRLTAEQIRTLRQWIAEGAEWPAHWAYVPPVRPVPPVVQRTGHVRNEIDRFVLAKVEAEGLTPSPEADRSTLIRRVSFDLRGLPPSVDEVEGFLSDSDPRAYERLVDRLLASQAYGERFAQYWLDLARYADSDGYHADIPRSMWQYRDWVVGALNRDLPFDQFAIEQLAGDLLPNPTLDQRIATAFNRNGMSSTEGGADPDEYLVKYVTDRVNTTSTVFLGSTIQCAECHDHKYDPFTQREYYQLYDFFNRLPERGLDSDPAPPFVKVPTAEQSQELARLKSATEKARQEVEAFVTRDDVALERQQREWEQSLAATAQPLQGVTLGDWHEVGPFDGANGPEVFAKVFPPENGVDLKQTFSEGKLAWKKRSDVANGGTFTFKGGAAAYYVHRRIRSETPRKLTVYLGSDDGLRGWINGREFLSLNVTRGVAANQDKAIVELAAGDNDLLFKVVNHGGAFAFYFSTDPHAGDEKLRKLRDVAVVGLDQRTPAQAAELRRAFRETQTEAGRSKAQALAAARKQESDHDARIPTLRVMEDQPNPRPSHVRVRGDYRTLGERVSADVPKALPPLAPGSATNRLSFARWLVDRRHPLTARVAVNRLWQNLFGVGIVKTANEFGTQGELPTHPELLDWLACEFMDNGWSMKQIVKTIVMSGTYRQSSRVSPEHVARDPQNRWLSRGPRFRLPAEMVRDNALAVSGLLVSRLGGPSVRPYQPEGLWEEKMFAGNKYEVGGGDEVYRRSVYTLWKRTVLNPTLQTFDAPDRAVCTVTRPTTCTPLQAFVTLNDPTFLEAARAFADRILREGGSGDVERIWFACRTVLARKPTADEQRLLESALDDLSRVYEKDPVAARHLIQHGRSKPRHSNVAELAAWTGVASMLLNLDETLTKE